MLKLWYSSLGRHKIFEECTNLSVRKAQHWCRPRAFHPGSGEPRAILDKIIFFSYRVIRFCLYEFILRRVWKSSQHMLYLQRMRNEVLVTRCVERRRCWAVSDLVLARVSSFDSKLT